MAVSEALPMQTQASEVDPSTHEKIQAQQQADVEIGQASL